MLGQSRKDEYDSMVGKIEGRRTDALYVAVGDIEAILVRVKKSEAKIEMNLKDTDYGNREFACRDPEGNLPIATRLALPLDALGHLKRLRIPKIQSTSAKAGIRFHDVAMSMQHR